jgi:hypothetical protein
MTMAAIDVFRKSGNTAVAVKEGFGEHETALAHTDGASVALAAQAKAAVESRYIMALRRPRDWDTVRIKLLAECRRPAFAKAARYNKPIGKGVQGLSIRFVEAALRCMGNVLPEVMVVYDDATQKRVRVSVTDLESNLTYSQDVTVSKTVERSRPMDDGSFISVRTNSSGRKTFTVQGTDDDILNKENALISKAIRTLGLRLVPGDIQDEAEDVIKKTALNEAAKDPDAERKAIADAFASLNVTPEMLVEYIEQPLKQVTPVQLVELRALYSALRDGEATWKTVMDNKRAEGTKADSKAPPEKTAPITRTATDLKPKSEPESTKVKDFSLLEEALDFAAQGNADMARNLARTLSEQERQAGHDHQDMFAGQEPPSQPRRRRDLE